MKAEEQDQGGSPYGHRGESIKQASRSEQKGRRAGKASLEQIPSRLYHAVPPGCNDYRLAYRGFLLKSEPGNIFLSNVDLHICLHTEEQAVSCSDDAIQRHDQGPVKGLPTPSPCTATPMPVLPGTCTLLQASAGDPGTLLPHAMLVTPRAALSASPRDRVRSSQGEPTCCARLNPLITRPY